MHCQYCEDFDYDQLTAETGYKHHPSWQKLCSSAAQGCAICTLATENARERWREESECSWEDLEKTEQVYCSLQDGLIYWRYGGIQRSSVFVCVEGKPVSLTAHSTFILIACHRPQRL